MVEWLMSVDWKLIDSLGCCQLQCNNSAPLFIAYKKSCAVGRLAGVGQSKERSPFSKWSWIYWTISFINRWRLLNDLKILERLSNPTCTYTYIKLRTRDVVFPCWSRLFRSCRPPALTAGNAFTSNLCHEHSTTNLLFVHEYERTVSCWNIRAAFWVYLMC